MSDKPRITKRNRSLSAGYHGFVCPDIRVANSDFSHEMPKSQPIIDALEAFIFPELVTF